MKFHGDIELNENELQQVVVQKETSFPSTAKIGRLSFIDQVLYMCVALNGTDPIWYPLTNKIDTYEHSQSTANTTWNVAHNLNTTAPIVQVMNNGNIIIPESIVVVDKNNITITFGTAVSGTATVMFGNVLSPLGTGILHEPLSGEYNFIRIVWNFNEPLHSLKVLSKNNLPDLDLFGGFQNVRNIITGQGYGLWDAAAASNHVVAQHPTGIDIDPDKPFSIVTWVDFTEYGANQQIVGKMQSSPYKGWQLNIQAIGNAKPNGAFFQLASVDTINDLWVQGSIPVINQGLTKVAVTYDGSRDVTGIKMYINDVLDTPIDSNNTLTANTSISHDKEFSIGGRANGQLNYARGKIYDVQLYQNLVLSLDYIKSLNKDDTLLNPLPLNQGEISAKAWKIEIVSTIDGQRPKSHEIELYNSKLIAIDKSLITNVYSSGDEAGFPVNNIFDEDVSNTNYWSADPNDIAPWNIGFVASDNIQVNAIAQHQYFSNTIGAWKDIKLYYTTSTITDQASYDSANWILLSESLNNTTWNNGEIKLLSFV